MTRYKSLAMFLTLSVVFSVVLNLFSDIHPVLADVPTKINATGGSLAKYPPGISADIIPWLTFLGGNVGDSGWSIAVDSSGNIYVTGVSAATWGSPVRAFTAGADAFVAKLSSSGVLQWNTFLGSSGNDYGHGIALDGSGNVYVTGQSDATWGSPVRAFTAGADAFVAELSSSGALQWNTFLGVSSGNDYGRGIAVDGATNVYISGESYATWGSPLRSYTGNSDTFVAKLASGGALQWNTFLGGSGIDSASGIAVDTSGNVYITGSSRATWGSSLRELTDGSQDAFVAKLSSTGSLIWNTFLGGINYDSGRGITLDSVSNIYITGNSSDSWGTPVQAYTPLTDAAFVAKLSGSGTLLWNTFLGGSGYCVGRGIAVDGVANVYISGESYATWGSPLRAYTGKLDAFVAKLSSSGVLQWNTFLGGALDDFCRGVAVDSHGNAYVTGGSNTTWGSPLLAYTGGAFIYKLVSTISVTGNSVVIESSDGVPKTANGTDFGSKVASSGMVDKTFTIKNIGNIPMNLYAILPISIGGANASDFAVTVNPTSTILPGGQTTFTVRFTPSSPRLSSAVVSIAGDGNGNEPFIFAIQGTGIGVLTVSGISAANKTYDGTPGAIISTKGATMVGLVGLDVVTLNTAAAVGSFTDKNAGNGKTVTVAGLTLSGANAPYYALTQPSTTANITPMGISVTANPQIKFSGYADPPFTYTVNPPLLGSDRFTGSLTRDPGEQAGYYNILQGTLTAGSNYAINFMGNTIQITSGSTSVIPTIYSTSTNKPPTTTATSPLPTYIRPSTMTAPTTPVSNIVPTTTTKPPSTGSAPAAITLIVPVPQQPIAFSWTANTTGSEVTYTLQISQDPAFSILTMEQTGITTNTYTMTSAQTLTNSVLTILLESQDSRPGRQR